MNADSGQVIWRIGSAARERPETDRPYAVPMARSGRILPMHGSGKEIGRGLEHRIKKDLGLK